jgi:hypothetical protein
LEISLLFTDALLFAKFFWLLLVALPAIPPESKKFDNELLAANPLGCSGGSLEPLTPLFLPLLEDNYFF